MKAVCSRGYQWQTSPDVSQCYLPAANCHSFSKSETRHTCPETSSFLTNKYIHSFPQCQRNISPFFNCFCMETWCIQFKYMLYLLNVRTIIFLVKIRGIGDRVVHYIWQFQVRSETWVCTSKWFSLDDFTPTVLHHSPLTFLWQTIPMKSSNSEGCVRASVSWKQTEQKWEDVVFVLQIWAVATKMQSHTQVYLSWNTMVPKYKTIVVPGPCALLRGIESLVPVPVGRGKNIQRVGGD